jgi:hypothetical protein
MKDNFALEPMGHRTTSLWLAAVFDKLVRNGVWTLEWHQEEGSIDSSSLPIENASTDDNFPLQNPTRINEGPE